MILAIGQDIYNIKDFYWNGEVHLLIVLFFYMDTRVLLCFQFKSNFIRMKLQYWYLVLVKGKTRNNS